MEMPRIRFRVAFRRASTLVAALIMPSFASAGEISSTPLPTRTPSDSAALFVSVAPDQTGVEFKHRWRSPETVPFSYSQAFMGCGVAIGDYDGDGRPDAYLSRASGGDRLYRNRGAFRFEDVTESAGVNDDDFWGMTGSFADVNNDGRLDLYVCGYDVPNKLFINQGNGTFKDEARAHGVDFKGASVIMVFADYDLDGDLDGYLLTNHIHGKNPDNGTGDVSFGQMVVRDARLNVEEEYREQAFLTYSDSRRGHYLDLAGQYDILYRNNGDGTFSDVTRESGISGTFYGLSATWWDYNADHLPDLYVANDYAGPDALYRNNGDGTFTDVIKSAVPHTPWFSMGSNVADLNNDGLFDYMGSDMSGSSHYKQKMGMGDMEAASWFLSHPVPRQYMRNALYVNTGTDRFMEAAYLAGLADTDWTWSIKFADFDNDGWEDLFITTGMSRDWTNSDLVKQSTGGNQWTLWSRQPPRREANFAFRNQGDLDFEDVSAPWGLDHVGVSLGAALGDLDGDGDLDLLVNNFEEAPGIYRNESRAGNLVKIRLQGKGGNHYGLGAVVRIETPSGPQTRYLTPYRGFAASDEPVIHFGLGDATSIRRLSVAWPGGGTQVFENLPANQFFTITQADDSRAAAAPRVARSTLFTESRALELLTHVEDPYDDFRRQPLLPNKLSQLGPGIAWGDVDGDGDDDVYLSGAAGHPGQLYFNEGDGRFRRGPLEPFESHSASEGMAPLFFDADGDRDLDLYVVNGGYEFEPDDPLLQDHLYLNDGGGGFAPAPDGTLPEMNQCGSCVVAADMERDGDLDLFIGGRLVPGSYPLPAQSLLLRNDGGRFVDVTDDEVPGLRNSGLVTGALWSDADGDGWLDLLVTHEWGPVKLYRNREGRLEDATSGAGLGARAGWWNGIAGGDVDRDGDIDYVVTNFGLNTKYHASDNHPAKAYYGDMDGSGRSRFVEAEYEGETLFPIRGKSCSTAAVPMLGEKYEAFSQFAQASLQEIYTPKCLQEAHQFEINTLESGLWVNEGDGRFTFRPLPRIAQISPAFGVLLEDVNGDGHLDLYLVQNFFSAQAETGRMDGGVSLLLRGRGDGSFQPVWPNESGLLVEGDGKGASRMDLNQDGWTDFAVSQNDGAVRIFLNRGDPENRMVRVQLRGSPGNPTGVGTRIKLESTDGSEQLREVYAGGSYLSQSSAAVHFGLGRKNRAATVEIRWPDGKVERRPVTEEGPLLTLDAPGEDTGLIAGKSRRERLSDQEIAKAYFESGKVLAARGRWDEAERHYRGVMALRPQWADPQAGLGEVLRRTGRPEEAVVWLERAMNLEPENVAARFQLGRIHQAAERAEIARTHFEDVLASDPEHAGAHYHLAFLLEEEGELDASYDHFASARSIDPGYGEETHFNFGRVHDARGRLALAWNHYRLALLTEPDNGETFNNLGSVCVRQGKIEEGISWLRKAVEHLEDNAAVHQNLGTALLQLDRREEAAESYRRTTELDADNYIAHTSLAFLLLKEGRKEEALHHYLNALRVKPDALESLNGAAWILATHEDESIRDAQRAVALAARACRLSQYRSPLLLDTLGAAYATSGDFDQAMRAMLKAIELDVAASGGKAEEYRERLGLYRQRKPYIETESP